jgi:gamma-glutamylcyclotransferase (GGCT)/AIG2-like uncharacterized protein YtfP
MPPHSHVFVYGTLRRGGSNHFRMDEAEFVAMGTVTGRLYRIDWYPGLVPDETAGDVVGEIYQAPEGLLEKLDAYEGAAYRRLQTQVRLLRGASVSAWIWEWLGPVDEARRIMSGDWLSPLRSAEL